METWFRLRHLQSISALNLNISIKDLNCNSIFFALSTTDPENLGYFYQSSKCENLLNPVWENIDLSYDSIKSFSFLDNFIITFFINKRNKNKILLEIKVNISGLILNSSLNSENGDHDCQKFFYQFNSNWYSYDFNSSYDNRYQNYIENPPKIRKKLYNLETIDKFLGFINNDYNRQLSNAQTTRKKLENKIYDYKCRICQQSRRENKIIALKGQILLEEKIRNQKNETLSQIKKSIILLKQKIIKTQENQERTEMDIADKNKRLKGYRESYLKVSNDYMLRMYQLIHELAKIFPITPTELPVSINSDNVQSSTIKIRSTDKLSICNLHLPNNDKQITINQDNSAFAALGIVCQLLIVLSKIYDVPLRYPLTSDDPKLSIRDEIIDIDNNDRNFLLVKSTAPNFRLQYAIYLLNLNIAAIRGYFSLSTKFPDRMLWNINSLIEGKNRMQTEMGSSNNLLHSTQIISFNNSSTPDTTSPTYSRTSNNPSPLVTQSFPSIN